MPFSRAGACIVLVLLGHSVVFSQPSPVDIIPKSARLEASLTISGDDEGISWIVKRLKTYLLARYSGGERVEDFTFLDVDELAFGLLPENGDKYASLLAARIVDRGEPIRVKTGKHEITINIRNKDTARTFKRSVLRALLELLIEKGSESSEKVASPRGDIEIVVRASSYTFLGENVVVGSSTGAVAAAKGAFASKDERISSSPAYRDIGKRLFSPPFDLRVFVDNRGDDFKRYIALCRADWGAVLLRMVESIDYLGVAGDILDGDSMKARIVTHSPDRERALTTLAVIKTSLPLFLQKYLGGKVKHAFEASLDGLYVTVDVDVSGLSGYWDRLFEVKEQGDGG